ncbi:protein of unknown function [Legionella micdadei]|uniref:Uncharacterized protein n=1 Tax=Legionella micdadei TaxID=451 RepID=A0A098GCM0_LEGMI|nr:protein of unknown function [Legionella micdadei]
MSVPILMLSDSEKVQDIKCEVIVQLRYQLNVNFDTMRRNFHNPVLRSYLVRLSRDGFELNFASR